MRIYFNLSLEFLEHWKVKMEIAVRMETHLKLSRRGEYPNENEETREKITISEMNLSDYCFKLWLTLASESEFAYCACMSIVQPAKSYS